MIMTDADNDGIHIASLIMNTIHFLFPSLLNRERPFVISMQTPIIKIINKNKIFYRQEHYDEYKQQNKRNDKEPNYRYFISMEN